MTSALLPPPDVTVQDFFGQWLPEAFARSAAMVPERAPKIRVSLSGAGGGAWDLRVLGNALHVQPAPARDSSGTAPDLWLRQSTDHFLAVFRPSADLPRLLPPGWGALDLLFLDERDVDLLSQIEGRLLLLVLGKRRCRWSVDLAFGTAGVRAGRPRTTVRIDGATYEAVSAGRMAPLQALIGGHIDLDGDRALALQALMLLMARLARKSAQS